jgi:hypothetical protein
MNAESAFAAGFDFPEFCLLPCKAATISGKRAGHLYKQNLVAPGGPWPQAVERSHELAAFTDEAIQKAATQHEALSKLKDQRVPLPTGADMFR